MTDTKPSKTYEFPDDRYYDAVNHQWAKLDTTSGQILVGLDVLGLEALGELAYITLEAVGTEIKRGDSIGTLEAAKMTGNVFAPVSGTLVARNEQVLQDPILVNNDPYDQGWIVAIEPDNWGVESAELIHGPALPAWVQAEVERYQDQGWVD